MPQQNTYIARDENQILKYLPLVENIVDRMIINNRQSLEKDDYIMLGTIGLIDALDKFDPSHNIPFEHYAKWRIRGAIYDELRKNGSISRSRMDKLNAMYEAKSMLQQQLLREPTDLEISEHLNINIEELHSIYETIHYLSQSFLEETLFVNDDECTLAEIIADDRAPNPQEILDNSERKAELVRAIDYLSEREKILLNLYYKEEIPLKAIAEILEISISRVSQIHGKILLKLREFLKEL